MLIGRRALLGGLIGLVAAPAIVHATSIMPVRSWKPELRHLGYEYSLEGFDVFGGRVTRKIVMADIDGVAAMRKFRQMPDFKRIGHMVCNPLFSENEVGLPTVNGWIDEHPRRSRFDPNDTTRKPVGAGPFADHLTWNNDITLNPMYRDPKDTERLARTGRFY